MFLLFLKPGCPYCESAVAKLEEKNLKHVKIDVVNFDVAKEYISGILSFCKIDLGEKKITWPQIFFINKDEVVNKILSDHKDEFSQGFNKITFMQFKSAKIEYIGGCDMLLDILK